MALFRTILLYILAILAVLAAVFQTKDGSLARLLGRGAFEAGENLFSFSPQKASLIIVKAGDIDARFVKKENGVWWATAPWNDRMDPRAAEAIIRFSLGTRVVDTLPLNNTVKGHMREFGVENSCTEVIMKDKGEHSLARFKLGNLAPWIIPNEKENETNAPAVYLHSDYNRDAERVFDYSDILSFFKNRQRYPITPTIYLQTDLYQWMSEIFVTTGDITPLFKDGLRYLRDHRPLYISSDSLKNISIKTEREDLVLSRNSPKSPWKLTAPIELKADQAIVQNLIGVLQKLEARKVYDPEALTIPEKKSPKNKYITLSFFSGAQPVTLTIHPQEKDTDETVLATVSDRNAVFALPFKPVEDLPGVLNLSLTQKLLRAKNLSDLDRTKLKAISLRIIKEDSSLIIRKTNKRWTYSENGSPFSPVNEEQLYNLLFTVSHESVADFATDSAVDLDPYGLNNPLYSISFGFEGSNEITTLFIGQGIDDKFYAIADESPSVYVLSQEYVSRLGLQSYMWKPLKMVSFNFSDLTGIISQSPGVPVLKLTGDYMTESWKGSLGDKNISTEINPNKVTIYVETMLRTDVLRWLPPSNTLAREALKNPTHTLTFEIVPTLVLEGDQASNYTETLRFAPVGDKKLTHLYYGQREGDSEYFLISDELEELLTPNFFDTDDDKR